MTPEFVKTLCPFCWEGVTLPLRRCTTVGYIREDDPGRNGGAVVKEELTCPCFRCGKTVRVYRVSPFSKWVVFPSLSDPHFLRDGTVEDGHGLKCVNRVDLGGRGGDITYVYIKEGTVPTRTVLQSFDRTASWFEDVVDGDRLEVVE